MSDQQRPVTNYRACGPHTAMKPSQYPVRTTRMTLPQQILDDAQNDEIEQKVQTHMENTDVSSSGRVYSSEEVLAIRRTISTHLMKLREEVDSWITEDMLKDETIDELRQQALAE
jgi:hypothetical protein